MRRDNQYRRNKIDLVKSLVSRKPLPKLLSEGEIWVEQCGQNGTYMLSGDGKRTFTLDQFEDYKIDKGLRDQDIITFS